MGLLLYPKLTHPSTCIVYAEYHYCVTVYRSDVQPELQNDYKLNTYGFSFFPRNHINQILTHPSTCYSHAEYHYCVTVYRSDMQSELQSVFFKIDSGTFTTTSGHEGPNPLLCDCLLVDCTLFEPVAERYKRLDHMNILLSIYICIANDTC